LFGAPQFIHKFGFELSPKFTGEII
jgi:hypothetical protein